MLRLFVDGSLNAVKLRIYGSSVIKTIIREPRFPDSYLGHVMTANCRDDKDIKKQFRRQNAVGNMLVNKFSFAPTEAKIQLFKSYYYAICRCVLWHHS